MLVAAVALAATLTLGRGNAHAAKRALWVWKQGLPGQPIQADAAMAAVARAGGVDSQQLREVARAESGDRTLTLLSGPDGSGHACFSVATTGFATQFHCGWQASTRAILARPMFGGTDPQTLNRGLVVGVARGDVARLILTRSDGTTTDLTLNFWNGFAYGGSSAGSIPVALTAYNAAGRQLDRMTFEASAPCGGLTSAC
ncbi:MAG TPA: hypothetical protein VF101_09135 [Gaiellaceae bacterium]